MKTSRLIFTIAVLSASTAHAQLNIIPQGSDLVEYSQKNAVPYDSLAPFHQSYENYPKMPGQTLFFQGTKNDKNGYAYSFFTTNPLTGDAPVYSKMDNGAGNTAADAVVGKYYDVMKVFCHQNSRYCLLLREHSTGDEIYYLPSVMTTNSFICLGNYEKMKQLHVGKTFYALGKRIGQIGGGTIQTEEKMEYKAIDMALELHDNGAYLILESTGGQQLKGIPYGHIVAGFVSKERLDNLIARYGKDDGERIAFQHIMTGMSKEMLVEALGKPVRKGQTTVNGESAEIWRYPDGRDIGVQNDKVISTYKSAY